MLLIQGLETCKMFVVETLLDDSVEAGRRS